MTRRLKLANYRKFETKTFTISLPVGQYAIMEQFADATHRTLSDVASEIFLDHTLPKIKELLRDEGLVAPARKPTPAADAPTILATPNIPRNPATRQPTAPNVPKAVLPLAPNPIPPTPAIPLLLAHPTSLGQSALRMQPVEPLQKPPTQPVPKPSDNNPER